MNLDFNTEGRQQFNRFSKLGIWYALALSAIACVAVIGQILIQRHLTDQRRDSHTINIAGAQRYKSQWIVKNSLLLCSNVDSTNQRERVDAVRNQLTLFKKTHQGLQTGDVSMNLSPVTSDSIISMFAELNPYFGNIYSSTEKILTIKSNAASDQSGLDAALNELLQNEVLFLDKMDDIVFQFDEEASRKVTMLSTLEYFLLGISILVIVCEIVFVFRPTTVQVNHTIDQLMASEKNAKKLSKEIGALYASLEKSYEELSIVNQPVENPRLFAKADRGGNVTFIGEELETLTGMSSVKEGTRLSDLFIGMADPDDWMDEVIGQVSDGETWQGEVSYDGMSGRVWAAVIVTPVFHEKGDVEELMMMGADITRRKEAELNMNVKNRAAIEKKINQQKFRSVLILEGQEEERKRIAMDIHDGIGQMLTSLKFQIESIDLNDNVKATQKIGELRQLSKEVIREVRRVTFNLKPTVLGDYGLDAALNVFVKEIGKLTDIPLEYTSDGPMERLPQKTENNIFRIIQEAINNAIKYSGAPRILVDLSHTGSVVTIRVRDEGSGFDPEIVEARSTNIESGRGFFNMYERTEYVNGTLSIDAEPGKGTTVVLTVPVHLPVAAE